MHCRDTERQFKGASCVLGSQMEAWEQSGSCTVTCLREIYDEMPPRAQALKDIKKMMYCFANMEIRELASC